VLAKPPNTVKDAIDLVESLGERYLWVDSLCIVQDDDEWKCSQINNMASIYANSHLTIIAADGDSSDYGLRGLRGISGPRQTLSESSSSFYTIASSEKITSR
jgi:Heterokaryon incompatibility protein (HET)